jgi:hypothetical protein
MTLIVNLMVCSMILCSYSGYFECKLSTTPNTVISVDHTIYEYAFWKARTGITVDRTILESSLFWCFRIKCGPFSLWIFQKKVDTLSWFGIKMGQNNLQVPQYDKFFCLTQMSMLTIEDTRTQTLVRSRWKEHEECLGGFSQVFGYRDWTSWAAVALSSYLILRVQNWQEAAWSASTS